MAQNLFNLPVGAKVKFGRHSINGETPQDITWLVVAKNHQCFPAYPSNSVTLFAEKIIDIRCLDEKEPAWGAGDRANYGNNRYSLSNLDQWLNKSDAGGQWYVATHQYDSPPSASDSFVRLAPYTNRPAFLHFFTTAERESILNTTIRVNRSGYDGGGADDITRKVFLPSEAELISSLSGAIEGARWSYFNDKLPTCTTTQQCLDYSPTKPTIDRQSYWLRGATSNTGHMGLLYKGAESSSTYTAVENETGVRPAINLSSTVMVSDTTDAEGCYTVTFNNAPSAPVTLNLPSTVYGGKTNNISWSAVTDPDGDAVTYELECAYDGGSFSRVYSGSTASYSHNVTYGKTSIQYRVRAVDINNAYSGYTTSATVSVVNNRPPEITGGDSNLGVKTSGFTQEYTITDADDETVSVVEQIDGVQIRSYVATNTQWVTLGERRVDELDVGAPCPPWVDENDWSGGGDCGNFSVEIEPIPEPTDAGKPIKIHIDDLSSKESYVLTTTLPPAQDECVFQTFGSFKTVNGSTCTLGGWIGQAGASSYDSYYQFFVYPYIDDVLKVRIDLETAVESGSDNRLETTKTFSVTGDTWLSLSNGVHTMTITATDSFGNTATKSYYFTKNITSFMVENATPMLSSTMPTRMAISVYRNIPPEALFKVEVCNNGNDVSPTWEDATSSVEKHLAHVFSNTSKSASDWGVCIRVTVDRNGADGSCYVTAIGGNFE